MCYQKLQFALKESGRQAMADICWWHNLNTESCHNQLFMMQICIYRYKKSIATLVESDWDERYECNLKVRLVYEVHPVKQ